MNMAWNLSQHQTRRWTLKPLSAHESIYFLDATILAKNNILELIFPVCSNNKLLWSQWNIQDQARETCGLRIWWLPNIKSEDNNGILLIFTLFKTF